MPEETRSMINDLARDPEEESTEQGDDHENEHGEPDADDAIVKDLIAELKKFDIIMPEDTNEENFFERLQVGLKTAAAHQGLDDADENPSETDTTVADAGGVAMMSLDDRRAIESAKRQQAYAENQHREAVRASLQALLASGRCTPAEFHEYQSRIPAVRLSLDESGNPEPSDLDKWIRSRQPLPRGTFWDPSEKSARMSAEVEEPPDAMAAGESSAKVNAVLDAVFRRK